MSSLRQGNDLVLRFALTEADGTPVDLTGAVVRFGLGRATFTGPPVVDKSTADHGGRIVDPPTDGVVEFPILAAEGAQLPPGTYGIEVKVTLPDGSRYTAVQTFLSVTRSMFAEVTT